MRNSITHPRSLAAIALSACFFLYTFFHIKKFNETHFINYDSIIYYSYLPAAFIHHDLSLKFIDTDHHKYGMQYWPETASNGAYVNKMTCGLAILLLPFFFIGHLAAYLTGFEMNGYTLPYGISLYFGTIVYSVAGLWLLRKTLLQFFNDRITALTILAIGVGTNLFFYTAIDAIVSHAYNFFLACAFLYLTFKWYAQPTLYRSILTGLTAGMIILLRPVNVLMILFFLLYDITSWKSFKAKLHFFVLHYNECLIICLAAFIVFIPQFLYWKYNTGDWLYYSYGKEHFYFTKPHVLDGLFSYRKGWLLYTPIMALSIIGMLLLKDKLRRFTLPVITMSAITIYVTYCWWCWWYGGCFGGRSMIDYYPFLSIPLAALYEKSFRKTALLIPVCVFTLFFIYMNIFQSYQQRAFIIHYDSMTKKAYWDVFLKRSTWADRYDLKTPDYVNAYKGIYEY
ncbi:MAG: hypothetical protein ABI772_11605 [Bacteroidota bacterium]